VGDCVVVRVGKLGDHIVALPAIGALCSKYRHIYLLTDKSSFPGEEIFEAVEIENITVIGLFEFQKLAPLVFGIKVKRIIIFPQRDANIITNLKIFLYCLILFPFAKKTYNMLASRRLLGFYEADRCFGFIASVMGSWEAFRLWKIRVNILKQKYQLPKTHKFSAVIHADASIQKKKWPWENFDQIRLSQQGPDDRVLVIAHNNNTSCENYTFITKLPIIDLFSVIINTDLFLGTDSGPMQIAIILGARVIAIQSSHDTKGAWFPEKSPFKGQLSLCVRYELECSGCGYKACTNNYKCTIGINPKEIIRYVE
jgi:ADP-heptose:LPS heptosyltransferase